MADLYSDAHENVLSCYFVMRQRYSWALKMFDILQVRLLLRKDQEFSCN